MNNQERKIPIQQKKLIVNLDVDISKIKSSVLRRIVEEVKNKHPSTTRAFDRVHIRHNRGG